MKILVAQLNPWIGDFKGNADKIIAAIAHAQRLGADIVVFPEMALAGYPPEDLLLQNFFVHDMERSLQRIVESSKGLMVIMGLVRPSSSGEKGLHNSAAIIADGKLLGFYDKRLLPTYDVFDERRYFEPGKEVGLWQWKGKKIAVTICEDIWQHSGLVGETKYPCDPIKELERLKPDLAFNLSSSPYQFLKPEVRLQVCAAAAKTLLCPLIFCCQVGGNDELVFDGYSMHVDEKGVLRHLAKGFEEDLMFIDLSISSAPIALRCDPLEDLYRALVLGVRDYFHKSGFKKACLGLSGGIDSALAACIAVDALGKENVLGIAMPSRYSSKGAYEDAAQLAQNLGIELWKIPIEEPFSSYLHLLAPFFQGKAPDITEENLQARIRGMLLMAISNKFGHVVLSTGNKSELALGYCTLYGDMCGGLALLSDLTKMQIYSLSRWINRKQEVIPQSSIDKPPSAELKPDQRDTDSLPPYPIVDAVLEGYVEDQLSVEEVSKKFQIPQEVVADLVRRIHRAEYKRRQAAPGIRVTKKAFRAGRRYPIVQGWK